jgi:phosphoglycolate phosphatase-like HAD superfamily hydrolase
MMYEYDAVLFDKDGVLVELTELETIYDAVEDAFGEFGVEPTRNEVERLVGCDAEEVVEVCGRYGVDPGEFWRKRDAKVSSVQRDAFDAGNKNPYVDIDVVERIAAEHTVGVVSNNQRATVDHVLEGLGVDVETSYGREHSLESHRRKKPSPHYVERALEDIGTRDAVYVGDSHKDVVAAHRAGVDSAFVRREHRSDVTLETQPTYEVGDLHELEKELRL